MKKRKRQLGTFGYDNAAIEIKNGDKVMKLKEERGLLQRFVIAARSRPELDLKECIGTFEFGIIPRSLFLSDGSLLLPRDKSKIMQGLEGLPTKCTDANVVSEVAVHPVDNINVSADNNDAILFDGMELVNSINKTSDIETCLGLFKSFIRLLVSKSNGYDEVHLIFDRYLQVSPQD